MAQKRGLKVSTKEATNVRSAPTNRTIHNVFTIRRSRETRKSRKIRMLELTPVSPEDSIMSMMMSTHEDTTITTCWKLTTSHNKSMQKGETQRFDKSHKIW